MTTAERHLASLDAKVKAYLAAGDRETAARFALELQRASKSWPRTKTQLEMHEQAYDNNVAKIKHAAKKLAEVRTRIAHYDAELKMSNAEAEIAKLANNFNVDITTDFGQIEQMLQDKISLNRAKDSRRRRPVRRFAGRHSARTGDGVGPGRTSTQAI